MPTTKKITAAYKLAQDAYAAVGVDTEKAIKRALALPISLHCWQTDDVVGLEPPREGLDGGGIMATGGYPGRARNGDGRPPLRSGSTPSRGRDGDRANNASTSTPPTPRPTAR